MRNSVIICALFLGIFAYAQAISLADLAQDEWENFKVKIFFQSCRGRDCTTSFVSFVLMFAWQSPTYHYIKCNELFFCLQNTHSKKYDNEVEERFRMKIYLENRHKIAKHNKAGKPYKLGTVSNLSQFTYLLN